MNEALRKYGSPKKKKALTFSKKSLTFFKKSLTFFKGAAPCCDEGQLLYKKTGWCGGLFFPKKGFVDLVALPARFLLVIFKKEGKPRDNCEKSCTFVPENKKR